MQHRCSCLCDHRAWRWTGRCGDPTWTLSCPMTLRQRADIAQCIPIMKMTEGSPSRVVSHGGSGVCGESTIQGCEGALCACCAPVQMVAPHGCQSMSLTESTCPRSTWRQRPRARSHSLCARREGGGRHCLVVLRLVLVAAGSLYTLPVIGWFAWCLHKLVPAQAGPCTPRLRTAHCGRGCSWPASRPGRGASRTTRPACGRTVS